MDVVASAVETCPWGLHRYGLDPYVAQHPGNSVAAVGSYWMATSGSTMNFEESHPVSISSRLTRQTAPSTPTAYDMAILLVFSFLPALLAGAADPAPLDAPSPAAQRIAVRAAATWAGGTAAAASGRPSETV